MKTVNAVGAGGGPATAGLYFLRIFVTTEAL